MYRRPIRQQHDGDDEPSILKGALVGLAVLVTLPVSFPAWVIHGIWRRARYDAIEAVVERDAFGTLAAIRAHEARRATEWVLATHSIASGWEEEPPLYAIELRDGSRRVLDEASGARSALDEASVPISHREVRALGMGVVVGAPCWVISLVVLAAVVRW